MRWTSGRGEAGGQSLKGKGLLQGLVGVATGVGGDAGVASGVGVASGLAKVWPAAPSGHAETQGPIPHFVSHQEDLRHLGSRCQYGQAAEKEKVGGPQGSAQLCPFALSGAPAEGELAAPCVLCAGLCSSSTGLVAEDPDQASAVLKSHKAASKGRKQAGGRDMCVKREKANLQQTAKTESCQQYNHTLITGDTIT